MPTASRKTAIVVLSDPSSGSEESLGRVFNALAAALDFQNRGEEVRILFHGAGTRWPEELSKSDHPANGLFREVSDVVAGASSACADTFGARDSVESSGLPLLTENGVPGTSGLSSLGALAADGFTVLTF